MTHYLFYQAGSIPGIPGTFAGVRADVDEDGNVTTSPLALPAHQEEAPFPVSIFTRVPVQVVAPVVAPPQTEPTQEEPVQTATEVVPEPIQEPVQETSTEVVPEPIQTPTVHNGG